MSQLSEEQQERVKQIRERQPESWRDRADIDFLLSLLDSDSQAAAHGPSNLLRRLKDFLFENCNHSDRDRNYDWCPSCVMEFMEVVAQPGNADSTAAMRDKCVDKLHQVRDNHLVSNNEHYEKGFNAALKCAELAMRSLTLDQVKPEEQK